MSGGLCPPKPDPDGSVKISEEAIAHVAMKAIESVEGVTAVCPKFITGIRFGRKTVSGVRVNVSNDTQTPEVTLDAYVSVRYGLRLPDVCWDLQETVKKQLEKSTGYAIKAVNVYVNSIDFSHIDVRGAKENNEPNFDTMKDA